MTKDSGDSSPRGRAAALTTEVEGYLMAQAQYDDARREAADLCARMQWLTTAQAEDLTRHYMRHRRESSRRMLLHVLQRAGQLRQEYEHRYSTLRRTLLRRHAACACASLVCLGGVSALVCLLSR